MHGTPLGKKSVFSSDVDSLVQECLAVGERAVRTMAGKRPPQPHQSVVELSFLTKSGRSCGPSEAKPEGVVRPFASHSFTTRARPS